MIEVFGPVAVHFCVMVCVVEWSGRIRNGCENRSGYANSVATTSMS